MFRYSPEQKEFIRDNVNGRLVPELTTLFNTRFGVELKHSQIRAFIKNNGFKSGIDARFKQGSVPFNKGKRDYVKVG
ncbi:hypothetical protein PAV_1c01440 [Paenibacillus alvei DSM 29]|uniref:hypothetical protein n=1 Tax=Paenibacillus alvei TaxID=44250 RepID=UPI000288648E|nr:hypothetical protein [Paenibacillus alvei]EJW19173.1 hypothetical protein PAV_1c01440 [Paenibacillus alvei DSM 29]